MVSLKKTSRKTALLLSVALGLYGLNLTGWRAIANSAPAQVTTYITDFDGKSGGVPAGWTDVGFDSSAGSKVVEKGTVVAIKDVRQTTGTGGGPQLIQSNFTFAAPSEPSATVTLTAEIASTATTSTTGQTQVVVALGNVNGNAVVAQFNDATKLFHITLAQSGIPVGSFPIPVAPHRPDYAGGKLEITLSFDADSLRLTSGAFDSGELPYASAGVPGFDSLDDFGAAVGIILGTSAEGSDPENDIISTVEFDGALLDVRGSGPSPQQLINALDDKVGNLADVGSLTRPQANGLQSKIKRASKNLDQGSTGGACILLDEFIRLVGDCVSAGPLSSTAGQELINDAIGIKTNLGC